MPLQGLYPPFLLDAQGSGTTVILTVVDGLQVEYTLVSEATVEYGVVNPYDVVYETITEVGL